MIVMRHNILDLVAQRKTHSFQNLTLNQSAFEPNPVLGRTYLTLMILFQKHNTFSYQLHFHDSSFLATSKILLKTKAMYNVTMSIG